MIYIGEAGSFGQRFGGYFCYAEDKGCKIRNEYYGEVYYIQQYSIATQDKFMRLALEEYLINKHNPELNIMGNK